MIFEYVGNLYSVTPENLRNADAIEIKIGQGTKPGMGGHLPEKKSLGKSAKCATSQWVKTLSHRQDFRA